MSLRCPLCVIRAEAGGVVRYSWEEPLEILDSNAGPDNAVSEVPYSLSSYSHSISPHDCVSAEFDIPTPTSSLPDLELRAIGISVTRIARCGGLTVHARRLSFR